MRDLPHRTSRPRPRAVRPEVVLLVGPGAHPDADREQPRARGRNKERPARYMARCPACHGTGNPHGPGSMPVDAKLRIHTKTG